MLAKIPLQAIPNQTVRVNMNNQNIMIELYLATCDVDSVPTSYMYANLWLEGESIASGVLCNNLTDLKMYDDKLKGHIFFLNIKEQDPMYTEFNGETGLYYADFDFKALYTNQWILQNLEWLLEQFGVR
jgi:hypothetical protein